MVSRHSLKTRFLALFVTVFVCLNGAGAACVAYCQTMDEPRETADHCPLRKLSEHCDKEGEESGPSIAVEGGETDCCPMTVSFFAAPIEKHSYSVDQSPAAAVVNQSIFRPAFGLAKITSAESNYRGPPPLDRRVERIKNRILRI